MGLSLKSLLGGALGLVRDLLSLLPILEDKIKIRMTEANAADAREMSAAGHEFCRELDGAFDMVDEAVSPTGPQGDDITPQEFQDFAGKLAAATVRGKTLAEKIKAL